MRTTLPTNFLNIITKLSLLAINRKRRTHETRYTGNVNPIQIGKEQDPKVKLDIGITRDDQKGSNRKIHRQFHRRIHQESDTEKSLAESYRSLGVKYEIGEQLMIELPRNGMEENIQGFKDYVDDDTFTSCIDVFDDFVGILTELTEASGTMSNTVAMRVVGNIRKTTTDIARSKDVGTKCNLLGVQNVLISSLVLLVLATSGDMKSKGLLSKVFSVASIVKSLKRR
ncbi:TPA: hypothetical protein EYN98_13625 [Candidatus Poribacteria bacterium]|nr:hypothetical protein [Candidatus Poribacteria bacterium]HIA67070.1 hypothetical protein [Candidatus Poribacteria bacterium]HIB86905.1 hypothetical protein [Candidatus Poribacteria bacterium]